MAPLLALKHGETCCKCPDENALGAIFYEVHIILVYPIL
jgi:hypothetical protein